MMLSTWPTRPRASTARRCRFITKHRTSGTQGVALDTFLAYDWTLNIVPR